MKPALSVVIASFNQCDVLKKVLPFYENQTCSTDDFEVIIVDSTSTDGAQEFLKSFKPNFNFRYHIQKNNGKASARNKGVELAYGDYVLITDGDMIPDKDLISEHIKAHNMTTTSTCFEGLAWNLPSLEWPPKKESLSPQVGTHPKDRAKLGWYYFLTGNISFPRSLFIQEKGFDERFKGYGWEDLELGYRLEKKSIPLYYLRPAVNYHFHVISKDKEIERNIQKGESAKTMLALHPELKWFLGLNPVSILFFSKISKQGRFYHWVKHTCYPSKKKIAHSCAFWFLKEYNYIQGILR